MYTQIYTQILYDMNKQVHNRCIHNGPKPETPKWPSTSTEKCTELFGKLHYNVIHHRNEKRTNYATSNKIDESHRHNVEQKKPDLKKYTLYGYVCIPLCEVQ